MRHYLLFLTVFINISLWSQAPTANFTVSDDILCAGDCIIITNNSSSNTLAFSWTFTGATPATYNGQNPGPICFNDAGTFTVSLTVSNTFGSNTATHTITVGEIPSVNITLSDTLNGLVFHEIQDTTIDMFQEAYLYAEGFPAGGTLMWYPSGVLADSIFGCSPCTTGDSLQPTPFYNTCYVATYTTPNGCSSWDSICVNVRFASQVNIAVPNSFSPNGDGENDYFRILTNVDADNTFTNNQNNGFYEGGAIAEIDVRIYDRYGKTVFRTTDPHEGWDGTFKGKTLNPATYTYYISYRRIDGKSGSLKGNVTLLR